MSWLFGDTSKMTGSFPADVRNWGSSNVKKFEEFRAYVATVDKRCAGWLTDDMMVSSIPAHNSNAKSLPWAFCPLLDEQIITDHVDCDKLHNTLSNVTTLSFK